MILSADEAIPIKSSPNLQLRMRRFAYSYCRSQVFCSGRSIVIVDIFIDGRASTATVMSGPDLLRGGFGECVLAM